jgi:hypothetical protein
MQVSPISTPAFIPIETRLRWLQNGHLTCLVRTQLLDSSIQTVLQLVQ